jgi:hypothetical protein
MGLNIDGVTKWSYGAFNTWRAQIAHHEGFTFSEMEGCGGVRPWSEVDSVLLPLLDHPDDDGELTAAECAQMHTYLREVVDKLWPSWQYDGLGERQRGLELADAMKEAAEGGWSLEFQ